MFAAAFSAIARGFSGAFAGPFQAATIYRPGTPTYDAGGSITAPGTPQNVACQAMFDAATEAMRADPGFAQKDMRAAVLADGLGIDLTTQDRLIVTTGPHAGVWGVESAVLDPLGIGWECRVRKVG